MPEISISINKFSITKNRGADFINLQTMTPDFLEQIKDRTLNDITLTNKYKEKQLIINRKLTVLVRKEEKPFYKYLLIEADYGEYGSAAKIKEIYGDEVVFHQKPKHVPLKPYYIFIAFPCGGAKRNGLVIFENIGNAGVKSLFTELLNKEIKKVNENFVLKINPVAPNEYVNQIINSNEIKKIKLIKYSENEDKADYVKVEKIYTYPKFKKLKSIIPNIISSSNFKNTGITEIDNFNPSDIKLTLDINGKSKTIGVSNIESVGVIEYINEDLAFDSDNLPTKESLVKVFKDTFEEYSIYL